MSTLKRLLLPALLAAASFAMCLAVVLTPARSDGLPTKPAVPSANTPSPFDDAPVAKLSWTSVYVGGFAGYGAAKGELTSGVFGVDGLSATGAIGGVAVGANWQIPGSFLVLGARGSYGWSREEFSVSPGLFKASIDNGWSADGQLGFAFGTAMPYIVAGYTTAHTSATAGTTALASPDLHGWRGGVGVEFRTPKIDMGSLLTPTFAVEVLYTDYDTKTFGTGPKAIHLDVTDLSAMARLNLRFGR